MSAFAEEPGSRLIDSARAGGYVVDSDDEEADLYVCGSMRDDAYISRLACLLC